MNRHSYELQKPKSGYLKNRNKMFHCRLTETKFYFPDFFFLLKLSQRQTHTEHGFNRQSNVLFVDEAEVRLKYDMKTRKYNATYRREGCSLHSFRPRVIFFSPFFQSESRECGAAPRSSALLQTFQLQTIRGNPTDASGKTRVRTTRAPYLTTVMGLIDRPSLP